MFPEDAGYKAIGKGISPHWAAYGCLLRSRVSLKLCGTVLPVPLASSMGKAKIYISGPIAENMLHTMQDQLHD